MLSSKFLLNNSNALIPAILFPFLSKDGEKIPMPILFGTTAIIPPPTPLFAGTPTLRANSPEPSYIAFDKFSNDRITEGISKIEHVERHPELIGYTPCILNIVKRTTGAGALDSCIFIVIELHRAADTIKPFVLH